MGWCEPAAEEVYKSAAVENGQTGTHLEQREGRKRMGEECVIHVDMPRLQVERRYMNMFEQVRAACAERIDVSLH
jgi:hypothetical protein